MSNIFRTIAPSVFGVPLGTDAPDSVKIIVGSLTIPDLLPGDEVSISGFVQVSNNLPKGSIPNNPVMGTAIRVMRGTKDVSRARSVNITRDFHHMPIAFSGEDEITAAGSATWDVIVNCWGPDSLALHPTIQYFGTIDYLDIHAQVTRAS